MAQCLEYRGKSGTRNHSGPTRGTMTPGWMTASEQMFFLGSPLDHVLRYEEELRSNRIRRSTTVRQARGTVPDLRLPICSELRARRN